MLIINGSSKVVIGCTYAVNIFSRRTNNFCNNSGIFRVFFLDHLNRRPRAIFYDCLMSMVPHLLVFRVLLVFIMEAAVLIRS